MDGLPRTQSPDSGEEDGHVSLSEVQVRRTRRCDTPQRFAHSLEVAQHVAKSGQHCVRTRYSSCRRLSRRGQKWPDYSVCATYFRAAARCMRPEVAGFSRAAALSEVLVGCIRLFRCKEGDCGQCSTKAGMAPRTPPVRSGQRWSGFARRVAGWKLCDGCQA